jgi:hypothetical protein
LRGEIMPSNRGIPSSEQDLMQMQKDAVRRVREMQDRSRIAVENANKSLSPVISREEKAHRHISEPEKVEHNEPQKRKLKSPQNQILRKKKTNSILPFDFPIRSLTQSLNYEDFLLIGLIILLITEEADEMIILALVYILVTELDLFG